MKVGVKNFRIFKDRTDFDIRPLTVFTGPNNAGKSALAKLFMLLQNGTEKLNYLKGRHKLKSFNQLCNNKSGQKFFGIYYDNEIDFFGHVEMAVGYIDSKMRIMKISSGDVVLLDAKYDENHEVLLNLNYRKIINTFLLKENLVPDYDVLAEKKIWVALREYINDFDALPELDFNNYEASNVEYHKKKEVIENLGVFGKIDDSELSTVIKHISKFDLKIINAINTEIDKLNTFGTPYALFDIYQDGELVTEHYYSLLLEIQDNYLRSMSRVEFEIPTKMNFGEQCEYVFKRSMSDLPSIVAQKLDLENKHFSIKPSPAYRLIFEEELLYRTFEIEEGSTVISQFFKLSEVLDKLVRETSFISIDRGLQFSGSNNPTYELLLRYAQCNSEKKGAFIKKSLEILGFPSEVILEQVELINGIGIANLQLKSGDKLENIEDIGYGFSMLLPILLQIELGGSPIFIEEPEANLHPNYQSKLADIFVLATEMFPDIRIVLETHSEYLVRRLQWLTASGRLPTESAIIYYFNSDKNVNENNPKIIPIEILENGTMTEEFGPGFYDEASRLRFDLLKLDDNSAN